MEKIIYYRTGWLVILSKPERDAKAVNCQGESCVDGAGQSEDWFYLN